VLLTETFQLFAVRSTVDWNFPAISSAQYCWLELSSYLQCAVLLTTPVLRADTSRGVVTVETGGVQREIFGFSFSAQWHIYLAQVVFALRASVLLFCLRLISRF
jgi:hypothetical protein